MLHVVRMIQKRHPRHAGTVMRTAVFASGSALLGGLGLLMLG